MLIVTLPKTSLSVGAFVVSLLCLSSGAQTMPQVRLLGSSDPVASSHLAGKLQAIYSRLDENTKRSTFVLQNNSNLSVAGYVIRWELTDASGTHPLFQAYDEDSLFVDAGQRVRGFGLEQGASRILTPFLNIHESQASAFASSGSVEHLSSTHPMAKRISAGGVFTATLDSVIYQDGSYEGKDESELADTFMMDRNAKHDTGVAVLLAIREGESEDQIRARLEKVVTTGANRSSYKGKEGYLQARSRWSSALLAVDEHGGLAAVRANAESFAQIKQIHLRRR